MHKLNTWELVYKALEDQITRGILNPGEKLDEKNLSESLKVSRTPIREAIKHLHADGLVTNIPKKGSYVTKYSPQELDEIYRILVKLEGLAVALATLNIDKSQMEDVRRMHERMLHSFEANNYKSYLEENLRFHFFFSQISGNKVLKDLIAQLRRKIFRYQYFGITSGHVSEYIQDHERLLQALKNRDSKHASKYMELHVDRVRKILVNFYKNFR